MIVYHYTSSWHLPWILASRELRPPSHSIADFPSPDFIWATTDPNGDNTATARTSSRAYRSGGLLQVRFTFEADEFFPWDDVPHRHPQWTEKHIKALEASSGKSDPRAWRCRPEALDVERALAIDVRSYSNNKWRSAGNLDVRQAKNMDGSLWLVMQLDGKVVASKRSLAKFGAEAFEAGTIAVPFESLAVAQKI
ncbi:hypothetical protein PMI07_002395 [Rhizobium sp. CF080]|nr:hypothetical protein PMI07_002395 [Rhizobium sp. CF080]